MTHILHNDEGMWLPDQLPVARFKERCGFEPTSEWYEHIQKASVRMNNGGSASFVSPNGLIITNHHVAESVLDDLTTKKKDYIRDGFYAKRLEDEIPAKQLEVNVLWEIEDVTDRVQRAIAYCKGSAQSSKERKAEISRIEKESFGATGLRSDVVTLYRGGAYYLYRYKKYTDVRLVFAPEKAIASFGGDTDNYEFPRFCLDVAFLRVYENGQPLKTEHFFLWSDVNSRDNDLLFVAGHPGTTDRLSTLARLRYLRDFGLPYQLNLLRRREVSLQQFSGRSEDNERKALHALHGVQNIRKRFLGQLGALQNPEFIFQKKYQEDELRIRVSKDPNLAECRDAWEMIEGVERRVREIRDRFNLLEGGIGFMTKFFGIARIIVRLAEEDLKLNEERLPEFNDSSRDSLLHSLFSSAPIHKDLEQYQLADSLAYFMETLGTDDELVKKILGSKSPGMLSYELISATKLDSVDERKRLVGGGKAAIEHSQDPFIKLALLIDKESRDIRKIFEAEIEEVRERAYAKIAKAMFVLYGNDVYPDATFTLRITFGRVSGYVDEGVKISYSTDIDDIFRHAEKHNSKEPWSLPERWLKAKKRLALNKYRSNISNFNFITTHDTHGGNSGSPVFDSRLRFRGILFDGNIHANATTFMYVDDVARAVSVHAAGISTALKTVYGAKRLVDELEGKAA